MEKLMRLFSKPILSIMIGSVFVCLYFFSIHKFAVNFPYWDDYNAVLEPILKIDASSTSAQKLDIILAQHNEHRIAFGKVVEFLLYKVQGRVDFRMLIFFGNIGLLVLCATLIIGLKKSTPYPHFLIIIPMLLFSPLQGAQSIWAMACISNFWVMAFSVSSLLLLTYPTKIQFASACLLAVTATLTSGQGIFCFLVGAVALLIQRKWWESSIWFLLLICIAILYFKGYSKPVGHPPLEISVRSATFLLIIFGSALSAPILHLLNPIMTLIGLTSLRFDVLIEAIIGFILLGLVLYVSIISYYKKNLFIFTVFVFMGMLCLAGALSRSGFGLIQAADPHYRIISILIILCLFFGLIDIFLKKDYYNDLIGSVFIITATFVCILVWNFFIPEIIGFSTVVNQCKNLFEVSQDKRAVIWGPLQDEGTDLLWKSYLIGLMPLSSLHSTDVLRISESQLRRIATPENYRRSKLAQIDNHFRTVANIKWIGDKIALYPTHYNDHSVSPSGYIGVCSGNLFVDFPQR